jgi:hypothetical protein
VLAALNGLKPGSYTVVVRTSDGREQRATLRVPAQA